jgi:hypothetical protein
VSGGTNPPTCRGALLLVEFVLFLGATPLLFRSVNSRLLRIRPSPFRWPAPVVFLAAFALSPSTGRCLGKSKRAATGTRTLAEPESLDSVRGCGDTQVKTNSLRQQH